MTKLTREQILSEIDDVIRAMPPRQTIRHPTPENFQWLGRASAAMYLWDPMRATLFSSAVSRAHDQMAIPAAQGLRTIVTMLHQASNELRLQTSGPLSIPVSQGNRFLYFDEMRKIIEAAKSDLFFVDAYLDAEFVSTYLPQVSQGVSVRLLARAYLSKLLPAVELFKQSTSFNIQVRSANDFHDRFVFVDGLLCYHSSASFKDGAKKAPTLLAQVSDTFSEVSSTYERIWNYATVHL